MKQIIFVADFFYKDFTGGAELNDFSLIQRFRNKGIDVKEVYCRNLTIEYLKNGKDLNFIVGFLIKLYLKIFDSLYHKMALLLLPLILLINNYFCLAIPKHPMDQEFQLHLHYPKK